MNTFHLDKKFTFKNFLIGMAVLSLSFNLYSQTCSQLSSGLNSIQSAQYNMKTSNADDAKRLIELEKNHDATLSQLAIIHELHKINDEFFQALDPATQSISEVGFDNILDTIRDVASDNLKDDDDNSIHHLMALENMATMDSLLFEMRQNDEVDESLFKVGSIPEGSSLAQQVESKVNQITAACASKPGDSRGKLCTSLTSAEYESSRELVKGFINAFSADQDSRGDNTLRKQKLRDYHNILRTGINPGSDLSEVFETAKAANSGAIPSQIIAKVRTYASDNQNMRNLELAFCCTIPRQRANNRDSCKQGFQRSSCEEYTQRLPASLSDVLGTFVNYEQRVYRSLNFDFDRVTEADLMDQQTIAAYNSITSQNNALSTYVERVTGGLNFLGTGGARSQVTESFDNLTTRNNITEQATSRIQARLTSLFRKGKINVADSRDFDISGTFSIAGTSGIEEHDNPRIVNQINERICEISNRVKNLNVDCQKDEDAKVDYISYNSTSGEYEVNEFDKLLEVFGDGRELHRNWEEMQRDYQKTVNDIQAEINNLKSKPEYAHLEQIKNFMVYDYKSRCTVNTNDIISIASCNSDLASDEPVDYLIGTVGQATQALLAEYKPETIRNLNRLNEEQPNQGFSSPAIQEACGRISSMNTAANRTTSFERDETIRSRGYELNSDGDFSRRPSSGTQIGLGMLRGLGTSAPMLAGTFFQGRQLSDSIPFREQYIYNQMDQQYAFNWWQQNAPFNYFAAPGGFNNPYYLPQIGNTSSGFNFNTGGL